MFQKFIRESAAADACRCAAGRKAMRVATPRVATARPLSASLRRTTEFEAMLVTA